MSVGLFSPLQMGSMTLANRIGVPPMCQFKSQDGLVGPWHIVHYGKLAGSGAGLVVVEATAVSFEGRITPMCLGLWHDGQIAGMKELVDSARSVGGDVKLFIQLSHAGRKGSLSEPWNGMKPVSVEKGGYDLIAPSAVPYDGESAVPAEMTEEDIRRVIADFADAAERVQKCGFDGIQVHAAHGYLIHQFLSPVSNRRCDEWGGSLQNRMRFGLEVIRAIRNRVPDMPVMLRVSATDWVEGGWDEDMTVEFVREAAKLGCIAVDVSAGGLAAEQKIPQTVPGYQVCYAKRVRKDCGIPTFAVGKIKEPSQAQEIITSGDADAVCIGREMLRNPHWGWMAAQSMHALVAFPPPYLSAF